MLLPLVLLFVVVPIVEIYVIIQVGQAIGALWTIALLVADSILGSVLMRSQGRAAWRRFNEAVAAGRARARRVATPTSTAPRPRSIPARCRDGGPRARGTAPGAGQRLQRRGDRGLRRSRRRALRRSPARAGRRRRQRPGHPLPARRAGGRQRRGRRRGLLAVVMGRGERRGPRHEHRGAAARVAP